MTLCELEATGLVGWLDVAMALLAAFLCGGMVVWKFLDWLHRAQLLAALELGRRGWKP